MRTVSLHIRRRLKGRLQVVNNALPMFQMRYYTETGMRWCEENTDSR